MSDNEYKQAELFGKVVNIFADLPAKGIKDNGYLKAATGNDRISARRPYGQVFEFYNKAKFVFSTNGLPDNYSKDTSDAFYNRLSIIPFKHVPAKRPSPEGKIIQREGRYPALDSRRTKKIDT